MSKPSQSSALARARSSLDGLSVGDALGERFFGPPDVVLRKIADRQMPKAPWRYTDDTEMALSVFAALRSRGQIDQDSLAISFAHRQEKDRGYGRGAFEILEGIRHGNSWETMSYGAFGGGSYGNGAAMRVAPLGAYFADDLPRCIEQARLQAEVTHAHKDGIDGAIAIAVGTALVWRDRSAAATPAHFLEELLSQVPSGPVRDAIAVIKEVPDDARVDQAAERLGNGSRISAIDTVPLCLYVTARHRDYEDAFWNTVYCLGDRDTTCAIVGGMLAPVYPPPQKWIDQRENLPSWSTGEPPD